MPTSSQPFANLAGAALFAILAGSACGGVHASRGAPPPIAPLLSASQPDDARPIRPSMLRCETYPGRSTPALDAALGERGRAVLACYRASLDAGVVVRGAVQVDLAIADDGDVLGATVRDTDESLDRVGACVTDSFRGVRLPPPDGGCRRVAWAVQLGAEDASAKRPATPSGAITW